MITFNLKKQWFDKIKSGEKTHEYREVKPFQEIRVYKVLEDKNFNSILDVAAHRIDYDLTTKVPCVFVCGYAAKTNKDKRINGLIKKISLYNGKYTDLKIDKDVYDFEFELTP